MKREAEIMDMKALGWEDGTRMGVYGTIGHPIIELHGGPGATGAGAPISRELSDTFRAFSPWQRASSDTPLTVAQHINDLHGLIRTRLDGARPALVGESWGAMFALAYAAAYPDNVGPLALVGCGTFDKAARARIGEVIEEHTTDEMRAQLQRLEIEVSDPGERMTKRNAILRYVYDYDPVVLSEEDDPDGFDMKAHTETWADIIRCQETGLYPQSFTTITSPVIMLHGAYDPHPGEMTRDTLLRFIPHLEFRQWEKCGHRPWVEKQVKDDFFSFLRAWLTRNIKETEGRT
jgi:pimeloyl-ACP methyl ester carboxylesterase